MLLSVLHFTHSQKGVLVRNRCVKFAFNNGSFGAYLPAYCEPMTINKINHACLSFGLGVQFAVHFLPMPCYCWLGGCGGVHFQAFVITPFVMILGSNITHLKLLDS